MRQRTEVQVIEADILDIKNAGNPSVNTINSPKGLGIQNL